MRYSSIKIKISIALIIFLVILSIGTLIFPIKSYSVITSGNDKQKIIGELSSNDIIIQNLKPKYNCDSIGFRFATYGSSIKKGNIYINIESNGQVKKQFKIKASKLVDNEIHYIKYKFKKNEKYTISLTIKNIDSPITLYVTDKTKDTITTLNGKEQESSLYFALTYKKNNYFSIFYYLFAILVLLLYKFLLENGGEKND